MARADLINKLYSSNKTPLEFQFQSLTAPPLLSLLSPYDIQALYNIARDPKLSAKINKKLEMIKAILEPRGFIKFHSGTNRIVYRYLEDQSFLIKIALDKVGLEDNPMEYKNQFLLAPFVTKVFEVSPCGTIGVFERVEPITSRAEFVSIAEDVFDLINDMFVGEFVLEDIGTQYFMNWGIRRGFGPVLLDFPYCYKLDGNKLYCNKIDVSTGMFCGGAIDYDMGFNNLVCTKCGAKIFAKDLQMGLDKNNIILKGRKEHSTMKVKCIIPGQGVKENDTTVTAKSYAQQVQTKKKSMEISILNNRPIVNREEEMRQLVAQSRAAMEASINNGTPTISVDHRDSKVETETKQLQMNEAERNKTRHEYVPQQSAPYSRPATDLKSSYIEMNKDDEDEQEEEEQEEETAEEVKEEVKEEKVPTAVTQSDKRSSQIETSSRRSTATVRVQREHREPLPDIDDGADSGRYPAKKAARSRDNQGKFIKNK